MTASRFNFRAWDKEYKFMVDPAGLDQFKDGYFSHSGQKLADLVLMQSTGLCDKNGKEIFEGDILLTPSYSRYSDGVRTVIRWKQLDSIEPAENMIGLELPQDWEKGEIIGNIYENSELVK